MLKERFLIVSAVALLLICVAQRDVKAVLISMDSSFGPDTLTLDTDTNLGWLDVTLSTQYSYEGILLELTPGGIFEGFRLATISEVTTFWQNAGIPKINTQFVSENYVPVRDLMDFVGITGDDTGNLGDGKTFDFVAGHTAELYSDTKVFTGTLGAYDGDCTGTAHFGYVPIDNDNPEHGSWLVVTIPTPGAILLSSIGVGLVGWLRRRRAL